MPSAAQRQRVKTTLAKPRPLLACEHAEEWLPPQKSLSTPVAKSMVLSARSKDPIGQKHEWYASVGKFEDCSPSATNRSTYNATRCAGSNAPPLSAWNVPLDSVREVHPDYGCRMPMRSAHGLFDASHQMRNATSTAREASKTDDVPFKTHHNGMLRSKWMSLIGFQSIGQKEDVYESSSSASWGKQRLDRVSNGKRTLCSTDLLCGLVVVLVVTGSVAWLVAAFAFGGRADDGSSGTISQTASALHDGSSGYVPNAGSTGPRSIPPSAPSSLLPHSPSSPIQIPRPLPQSPPNMGNSGASTQQGQPNTEPQSAQGEDGRQSESPAATPPASPNRTSIAGTEATYNDTVVLNPTSGDQSAVGYTGIPLDVTIVDKPPPLPPRPPPPPPGGGLNGQPLNVTISVGTQSGGSGGSGGSGSNPNALSESATPPAHPPPTSPPVTPNPHSPPRPPPVSPSPSTPPFAPPPPPPVPSPPPSPPPPSPPSAPPRPPGTRSPPPSPPFPPPPPPPPPPIPSPPPLPPPPPPPSPPPPPPPSPSPPQTPLPSAPPGSPTPHTPPPPPVPPSPPPSWPPQTIAESAFQRYALMQLYTKTSGDTWTRNDRWGTADPCGGEIDANGDVSGPWYGLQCTQGRVSSMHLNSNHMVGSIPDSIGMLEYIRDLDLSRNHITGTIPSTLGNLKHLEQSLSIYDTQISGTIPRELGRLSRLKDGVNLFWNKLSGTVPAEISHLHPKECALSIQGMATNSFTCPLPSGLEHCRVDCHTECDDSVAGADCGSGGYDGMVEAEDAFGHLFAFSDSPPPSPSPYPPPPPPPSPPPPPPPPSPPSPPPPPPPSPPPPSPEPRPPPPTPPPPTPPPPTPPLPLAPGVLPGQESALANGANSDESSLTTGEATAVGTTTALVATTGGVALLALAVCFRRRRVKMRKQNSLPLLPSRQAQPVIDVDDTHVNASPRSNGTNSSSERLRMTASLPDIMRRRVLSMWNPGFGVESPRVANTSLVHTTAQIVPPRWDTVPVHSQSAPPGSISRTPDDAYLGDLQPTTVIGAGALGAQSSVGALQLSSGVPALTMQLPEAGHELDGLFSHRSHAESVTDSVYEMESVTARRANESDAPAASSLQAMGQSVMNAIDAAATFASTLVEPEPERPSQQDAASDSNDEGDSEHTASVVSDGGNQSPRSGEDSESHDEEDSHEDPADALGSQRGGCTVDDIDIDDEHTAGDDDADSYVSQSTLGAPAACSGSVALSSATLCGARLSRQHSCASNSAESRISMHSLATSTDTQIPVAARMPPPSPFTMQPNRYPQSSASRRTHRGSAGLSDSPAGSNHNSPRILGSTSSRRSSPRSASEATVTRV